MAIDKSLFTIEHEYLDTINELEEYFAENPDTDEIPDEFVERLDINKDELYEKLDNYRKACDYYAMEQAMIQSEIDKLQRIFDRKQKQINRLEGIMSEAVIRHGEHTGKEGNSRLVKNDRISLSVRYTRPLAIKDVEAIPLDYLNAEVKIPTMTWDEAQDLIHAINEVYDYQLSVKKKPRANDIKEAIEAGETVDGAYIDTAKTSFKINKI